MTVEDVLDDENIELAIEYLMTKKNACGDDGVWLHDLAEYWEWNKNTITEQIQEKKYYPQLIHNQMIVTGVGKHRIVSHMSSIDRLLVRAIHQVLQPMLERKFSEYSFAYQNGKGVEAAVRCAADYIASGCEYVVELDIKDYFDSIRHDNLVCYFEKYVADDSLRTLMMRYIMCKVEYDCSVNVKTQGLVQGNALSPLLSNLYLNEFDRWMETEQFQFTRYADNINIYVKEIQKGYQVLQDVQEKLKEYGLQIKADSKGVYPALSRKYLGYSFEKTGESVVIQKNARKDGYLYKNWHKSAIEHVNQNYYIVNDGILTKKDYSVLFENRDNRISIPVEVTNSINIYSDIVIGSDFLKMISQKKINLNVFDNQGNYVGSFYSAQQRAGMEMLMAQVRIYSDLKQRLQYAKKLDIASMHNLRCNLKYYQKKRTGAQLEKGIEYLSKGIKEMNQACTVEQVLLIEGRCRQKYYSCMNDMIQNDDFKMYERTKRPPKDPLNSMISFGNMCLYQRIAQFVNRSMLDVRISFVHSALKRYENLNLDLADIFKPIIVDRVIFSLINKKMISEKHHFVKEGEGVF